MKLYHYSKDFYDSLLTRRAQGKLTKEEIKNSEERVNTHFSFAPYIDSMSFFFNPIPSKLLAELYRGVDHHTWFEGNKLYEYIIDTEDLYPDIAFSVEESPYKVKFIDSLDWPDDDPKMLLWYLKEKAKQRQALGEIGHSRAKLEKQIKLYDGDLGKYYRKAKARDDWQYGLKTYAGNVPHVMLYPVNGKITYTEVNELTIGNDTRTSVLFNKTPLSSKW